MPSGYGDDASTCQRCANASATIATTATATTVGRSQRFIGVGRRAAARRRRDPLPSWLDPVASTAPRPPSRFEVAVHEWRLRFEPASDRAIELCGGRAGVPAPQLLAP